MIETLNQHESIITIEGVPADALPWVGAARAAAMFEAEAEQAKHRERLFAGEFDGTLMAVDPIADGRRYWEATTPAERDEIGLTVDRNSLTALSEGLRKRTYEVFPEREFAYSPEHVDLISDGRPMRQTLLGGLSALAGPERVAEYIEHATNVAIAESDIAEQVEVLALSPWQNEHDAGAEVEKLMVRLSRFDRRADGTLVMTTQYLGVPGMHLRADVLNRGLRASGLATQDEELDRLGILGRQGVMPRGTFGSVINVAAWLDRLSDHVIFMGEEIGPDQFRDYATIPAEAAARHAMLREAQLELSAFTLELAKNHLDPTQAALQMQWRVDSLVERIVMREPEMARVAFDDNTADSYALALELERQGLWAEADEVREEANRVRPIVEYCGAGSCGLERATLEQAAFAAKQGLDGEVLYFKDGKCGACGKKGIIMSVKTGDSVCECGGTKFNHQPRKAMKSEPKKDQTRPKGRKR